MARTTITIEIRDEAPVEEVRDALHVWADSYAAKTNPDPQILWSGNLFNVGTVEVGKSPAYGEMLNSRLDQLEAVINNLRKTAR